MKRKTCNTCKRLVAGGVCIACAAGFAIVGPVFHGTDPTSGSPTTMFEMLTSPAQRIPGLYAATEDRSDPWHTESTSGLKTEVDLVTIGSVSTTYLPQQPKYLRLPRL